MALRGRERNVYHVVTAGPEWCQGNDEFEEEVAASRPYEEREDVVMGQ